MPSVAMPHSTTRIFFSKSVGKDGNLGRGSEDGNVGRVLRSGKRLTLQSNEENQSRRKENERFDVSCYKSNGWCMGIPETNLEVTDPDMDVNIVSSQESVEELPGSDESRYKNVYDRKRRRSLDPKRDDRMLGAVYVRKKLRKIGKSSPLVDNDDTQDVFGATLDVCGATLDVTVDSSPSSSSRFTCFLISVLKFSRTSPITFHRLAAFVCREPIVGAFSRHGVHFKLGFSPRTSLAIDDTISSGFCRIFGDPTFVPLFWLDFLAAPSSFMNLHSVVFFRSLYLPHVLPCYLICLLSKTNGVIDEWKSLPSLPTDISLPHNNTIDSRITDVKEINMNLDVDGSGLDGRRIWTKFASSLNTRRKRSSLRSKRGKHSLSVGFKGIQNLDTNNQSRSNGYGKKTRGFLGLDMFENMDGGYHSLATPRSNEKKTDTAEMDFGHNHTQIKSSLVGLRNNVESAHCNANVLVIEPDRCYREEGATVMLECSTSKVWHVVVKAHGLTRYTQQTHEVMRPSMINRFTHAMIWTSEDGWKLEFCNRNDWMIFKELHKVCLSKNLGANYKTIPVPGVREVLDYDGGERGVFSRPEYYITVHNNEVARALAKKTANYDIEPDDEEWLENLNSELCTDGDGVFEQISAEKFEEIIDILEKAAYRCPSDVSNENKLTSLCSDLGRADIIAAVYQYWLKKRKQNLGALLGVFKCQPPRNVQLAQDNVLRKKRSFKKQPSQNGRGKHRHYFEAMSAEPEELGGRRVQEARFKAKEAFESALAKRRRAQTLMHNADLATYLAAMAVKIAETVQLAESSNGVSASLAPYDS